VADIQNDKSKKEEIIRDMEEQRLRMQLKLEKYLKSHEIAQTLMKYVDDLQQSSVTQRRAVDEIKLHLATQKDLVK
jgi:hypothetical protein